MTQFVLSVFCLGITALWGQAPLRPQSPVSSDSPSAESTTEIPILSVCEVLANASRYRGRSLIVVGRYAAWIEGLQLGGTCESGNQSIWLGYDRSRELPPPSSVPDFLQRKVDIIAKLPPQERISVDLIPGCDNSGLWAAIFGRLETDDSHPVDPRTGERVGFGHMAGWRTQLVYPKAGFWCLVPPSQHEAVLKQMNERGELGRVAVWKALKTALQRPKGIGYFDTSVKGFIVQSVQGVVVSAAPQQHPNKIEVAVLDTTTPEATLRLDPPLDGPLEPGTKIRFDGVAVAFSPNPDNIVLDVKPGQLGLGWK